MVVAVKATTYHVNKSIFALTIGAGQRGFLLVFQSQIIGKTMSKN